MALQQLNAFPRDKSGIQAASSPSGVTHVRHRHTERFTVVGNHLAQHRELSLLAKGLGLYIQSLPDGVEIGIKALAARCVEGEVAIASALRELEAHGYLSRTKERLASGRWVTRTVSYDMPLALIPQQQQQRQQQQPPKKPRAVPKREAVETVETLEAVEAVASEPVAEAPSLPAPGHPDLARHRTAAEILAGLRRHDPRLLLGELDIRRLAPAVAAWLERGIEPLAVQRTLTALLPQEDIARPAGLIAHRLTHLLPPPLPAAPVKPRVVPLQNCDHCDRAYRSHTEGLCPGCEAEQGPGGPGAPGRV
ncbi:helix-turn-helix domain-containing protein [Streptomyces sp. NPDC087658]|uniref:helix-turn-helix domain-containing protein n=1 Tax=Streptomyces sp. NPDC087658 TaxID=3365800 RepID=UPI00383073AC